MSVNLPIDKTDVLRLADQASNFYISGKISSLSAAVIDAVGDRAYNRDQLARVAEATNQATWAKLCRANSDPHTIRFEPADVVDIVSMKDEDEKDIEKTAIQIAIPQGPSLNRRSFPVPSEAALEKTAGVRHVFLEKPPMKRLEQILFPPTEKTAAERHHYAIPDEEISDWGRVFDRIGAAHEATEEASRACDSEFASKLAELTKTATQMVLGGDTPESCCYVLRQAAGREVGDALIACLAKEAFEQHVLRSDSFEEFIAAGAREDAGRVTLWDAVKVPSEKTASKRMDGFLTKLGGTAGLNPEHPLFKTAACIKELYDQAKVLAIAQDDLKEQMKIAHAQALRGEEVPVDV